MAELRGEIVELKARLSQNSRNSSKPPSSDGYAKPKTDRSLRRPSGRKPGGQSGSPGHHLAKSEHPDEVVVHIPERCDSCGGDLASAEIAGIQTRQVFDLPPVGMHSREHRAQRKRCACGHQTTAVFPSGVNAQTRYGPRMRALALYLVVYQHLPYKRAAQLLSDCLGARVSTGTLAAIVARGAGGLDTFQEAVRSQLANAAVVHFDETGGRAAGRLRWIHSASTRALTLYCVHDKRGTEAIDAAGVLGAMSGVAVHDGWTPYRRYEQATHALCNAHHLRELRAVIEQGGKGQSWAETMSRLLREIKDAVDQAQRDDAECLPKTTLENFAARYQRVIAAGHQQNPPAEQPAGRRGRIGRSKSANLLRRLDQQRGDVLRFAYDFRVPFDNNQAERDIRMVKLQQKISGCWRTAAGSERFLALRSYISTARKQQMGTLDVLHQLVAGDPWLPVPACEP